ncbi:hypothetical protein GCM10027614_78380 [Micromonospora vulcania]
MHPLQDVAPHAGQGIQALPGVLVRVPSDPGQRLSDRGRAFRDLRVIRVAAPVGGGVVVERICCPRCALGLQDWLRGVLAPVTGRILEQKPAMAPEWRSTGRDEGGGRGLKRARPDCLAWEALDDPR